MTIVPDRDRMLKRLHEAFRDPAEAAEALAVLDKQKGDETLQCAIIFLSDGNLSKVRELISVGKKHPHRVIDEAYSPETSRRFQLEQRTNPTGSYGKLLPSPKKAAKQSKAAEAIRKRDMI